MRIRCELVAPFVASSAVSGEDVARLVRKHTSGCLKCQARYSAMARAAKELREMATDLHEAPMDLEWKVMSSLDGELAVARGVRTPIAWAAAVVSAAVAVVVWRIRPRAS